MKLEENILKESLRNIKNNNYLFQDDKNYFILSLEMLENIGSLDSELRDELIYGVLYHWISRGVFNSNELNELLNISLGSSHLFYKFRDKDENAVFKRAFSVLIVALILNEHRKDNFLSDKVLFEVKDRLIEYMINEADVRGYVKGKGWAHSAAHTADALDELVQCDCFNKEDLLDILNVIKAKVCIGYYVYVDEESERMVTVVENIIGRKILSDIEMVNWLRSFIFKNKDLDYMDRFHLKVNVKEFLRSLYFRLLENNGSNFIIEEIRKILNKL